MNLIFQLSQPFKGKTSENRSDGITAKAFLGLAWKHEFPLSFLLCMYIWKVLLLIYKKNKACIPFNFNTKSHGVYYEYNILTIFVLSSGSILGMSKSKFLLYMKGPLASIASSSACNFHYEIRIQDLAFVFILHARWLIATLYDGQSIALFNIIST